MDKKLDSLLSDKNIYGKVFLFFGDNKYYRELYISKIKRIFGDLVLGINYIKLSDTNALNLIYEANTPTFGYENKLIVINNSKLFKINRKKGTNDNIDDSISNNSNEADILSFLENNQIPNNVTIIFNEDEVAKTKKIYKTIDKIGITTEFKTLTQSQLVSYVATLCKKYGVSISKDVATYFVECCNNNMDDIINEIRKLIEYNSKNGTPITKEHIDLITTKTIEAVIFDLTDNLGNRKIKEAINILDNLLLQKEPLQKIYIMIYRHYKNLYLYKYAKENDISDINELLGLHPFVANKLNYQIKNYSLEELNNIYKDLMLIDINNKSGNIDLYTGIISVMCNI